MSYVQGFVLAVPRDHRESYRQLAEEMASVIRGCGALKVVDCWGMDMADGELTSFPKAVRCKEDEVVGISWIIWESREACETGMRRMQEGDSARLGEAGKIFDTGRMFFGGFEVLVEL